MPGRWLVCVFLVILHVNPHLTFSLESENALAESAAAPNAALLVGISLGLPGINYDIENVRRIAENPEYRFGVSTLLERAATSRNILDQISAVAAPVPEGGTFFFYFSGHGDVGLLLTSDAEVKIEEIRASLENARQRLGPLAKLVMFFDSCASGSLVDPLALPLGPVAFGERSASRVFADSIFRRLTSATDTPYWRNLFVFASSRADEPSIAGENGSRFTGALARAFDETAPHGGRTADWIALTQRYASGEHPVARLSPTSLADEPIL